MGKAIPCTIIFNTRNGHVLQPVKCKSMSEALEKAKESGLAFRIFVGKECVKRGWFAK